MRFLHQVWGGEILFILELWSSDKLRKSLSLLPCPDDGNRSSFRNVIPNTQYIIRNIIIVRFGSTVVTDPLWNKFVS
jgi:hypothetical protein